MARFLRAPPEALPGTQQVDCLLALVHQSNVSFSTTRPSSVSLWKKSSFWGHRPALGPTRPRRANRAQSCITPALRLTLGTFPVPHSLSACPMQGSIVSGCDWHWPAAAEEIRAFVKLPYVPLGLGESRLSFQLSNFFLGFSWTCVLVLSNCFPRISQGCVLPILACTVHALVKKLPPAQSLLPS